MLGRDRQRGFQQSVIEERNSQLNRIRHAENVGIAQELIAHVELQLQRGQLLEVVGQRIDAGCTRRGMRSAFCVQRMLRCSR